MISAFRLQPSSRRSSRRNSFTLVELLFTIAIIALVATMLLVATYGAMENAREARTKAQIQRLHELVLRKYDEFRSRPIRLNLAANTRPADVAIRRLVALRETMRMELPDRITDVVDTPTSGISRPSLSRAYDRAARAVLGAAYYANPQPLSPPAPAGKWSYQNQGAECLYLIVAMMRDGGSSGLDFFSEDEIGDVDEDGMREILDGWGRPIEWLRWAPGFATLPGPDAGWGTINVDDDVDTVFDGLAERGFPGTDDISELQSRDVDESPDPFNPLHVDPGQFGQPGLRTPKRQYALIPLIYSAGRDGEYGIQVDYDTNPGSATDIDLFRYSQSGNDPYFVIPTSPNSMFGKPIDATADDNLSNHLVEAG